MPQSFCEGVLERIERELAIPQHDDKRPVDMREFLLVEAFPDLSRWMRHLQKNGWEPAFRLGEAISPRAASDQVAAAVHPQDGQERTWATRRPHPLDGARIFGTDVSFDLGGHLRG